MTRRTLLARLATAALLLVAVALALVPVSAAYLSDFGEDFAAFRQADCGPPVARMLGADPDVDEWVPHPIVPSTAGAACDAAARGRVAAGLAIALGVAVVGWGLARRGAGRQVPES